MDYLAYCKLALEEYYGGEFPPSSAEEVEKRFVLNPIPDALKACYMALGKKRICWMHLFLQLPEMLCKDGPVVIFVRFGHFLQALDPERLPEADPQVMGVVEEREDENGVLHRCFAEDDDLRLSLFLSNLIGDSAKASRSVLRAPMRKRFDLLRDRFTWSRRSLRRGAWLFPALSAACVGLALGSGGYWPIQLAAWCLAGCAWAGAVGIWARIIRYRRVWLEREDNVRFVKLSEAGVALIRDLFCRYLQFNQPEIWVNAGRASACVDFGAALREGSRRFCQFRYDFVVEADCSFEVPGFPPISCRAGAPTSVLLRATLDDAGCLAFTHCLTPGNGKFPKQRQVWLKKAPSAPDIESAYGVSGDTVWRR